MNPTSGSQSSLCTAFQQLLTMLAHHGLLRRGHGLLRRGLVALPRQYLMAVASAAWVPQHDSTPWLAAAAALAAAASVSNDEALADGDAEKWQKVVNECVPAVVSLKV